MRFRYPVRAAPAPAVPGRGFPSLAGRRGVRRRGACRGSGREARAQPLRGQASPAVLPSRSRSRACRPRVRFLQRGNRCSHRAKTKEGRLQVELAQMTYLLPRLTGRGVWLSRLGGGIGTRGPGETKLEVDRRRIRKRITDLKREIVDLSR